MFAEIPNEVISVWPNIKVKLNRIPMYRSITEVKPLGEAPIVNQTCVDECLVQIEEQCFLFANDPREL